MQRREEGHPEGASLLVLYIESSPVILPLSQLTSLSPALSLAPSLTSLDCSHNRITGQSLLYVLLLNVTLSFLRLHRPGESTLVELPEPLLQRVDLRPLRPPLRPPDHAEAQLQQH